MTSLLSGPVSGARWQAFVASAPLGRTDNAVRLAKVSRVLSATARKMDAAPDEARIARSAKGARVLGQTATASLALRGFTAGSVMESQSLLGGRVMGGGERIRTAFSKVTQSTKDAITVAANFQLKGPPKVTPERHANDELVLAALKPRNGPATQALGYAPDAGTGRSSSLFDKVLKEQPEAFVPPIGKNDHAWAATPLPASVFSEKEQTCLANAIYFESRGEDAQGQAAVAQVVLNRVRNPAYPKSICGVVYQNQTWRNRCQFSFACDGMRDSVSDQTAFAQAQRIAGEVTRGDIWLAEVGSATHYHATYVHPRWAAAMKRVDKIGKHIFYRTFGGGWN